VLSVSGVVNVLATSVGVLAPPLATKVARFAMILSVFGFLAAINIRGVRTGVRVVGAVTLIKLLPLIVFVLVGIFLFARNRSLRPVGQEASRLVKASCFSFSPLWESRPHWYPAAKSKRQRAPFRARFLPRSRLQLYFTS